jgi:hypothetical protein
MELARSDCVAQVEAYFSGVPTSRRMAPERTATDSLVRDTDITSTELTSRTRVHSFVALVRNVVRLITPQERTAEAQ